MRDFKVYQTSGMLNFLVSEASDVRKKEQTLSGDIVSFTSDAQSPIKIVVNIDSIGWTGCEVTRTGKNLFDETQYQNLYSNYDYVSEGYKCRFIQLAPNTKYTVSQRAGTAASYPVLLLNNVPKVNESGFFDFRLISSVKTFTTDATGKLYIGLVSSDDTEYNARLALCKLQIELGETATEYEPYSGTTLSVTFPDSVGTVTDGTLTIDYDGSATLETGGQTYTLTSVSPIETLIGDNNIWADAGPVSVTYPI